MQICIFVSPHTSSSINFFPTIWTWTLYHHHHHQLDEVTPIESNFYIIGAYCSGTFTDTLKLHVHTLQPLNGKSKCKHQLIECRLMFRSTGG